MKIKGKELDADAPEYTRPIKTRQVNICTEETPKITHIGDYWDEDTVN
jgi:hypothetical protein